MSTAKTHETTEARLRRGLNRILPAPHLVVAYSTTAACDCRATWAEGERLYCLEVEVKTTSRRDRWPEGGDKKKPDQTRFARDVRQLAAIVAPSVTVGDPADHSPTLEYVRFEVRGRGEFRVKGASEPIRLLLLRAWDAGREP